MSTVLTTILVIGVLIFIHELGHFWAARRVGVLVHELSLGFGPLVFSRTRAQTQYSLRLFPLGGFVRLAGMHPDETEDPGVREEQAFVHRSVGERMLVMGAGSGMNFVLAIVLFAVVFALMGQSEATLVVEDVEPGFPAAEAGIRPGDRVISIDGIRTDSWMDLVEVVQGAVGRTIEVVVERQGQTHQFHIAPAPHPQDPDLGAIGVRPVVETRSLTLPQAALQGLQMTGLVIIGLVQGIAMLVQGGSDFQLISIVRVGQEIGTATRMGLANVLFLTGGLSVSVGFTQLLPIPALDGSRLMFLGLEALRGRPVNPEKENLIHFVGFAFLMLLTVFIIYRDIAGLGG